MSLLDQLRWSWRHSRRQLLETVLVVLIIALGTATIVTVLTLFVSVGQQQKEAEKEDYFRTFQILDRLESSSRQNLPLVLIGEELRVRRWETSLDELEGLQRNLPDYMHVFVEVNRSVNTPLLPEETVGDEPGVGFSWVEGSHIFLRGTTERYFHFKELTLQAGNWFLAEDIKNQNRVVVLTAGLAATLFGEEDPIGKVVPTVIYDDEYIDYTVIGVLAPPKGEEQDYLDLRESRTSYIPVSAAPSGGRGFSGTFHNVSIGIDAGKDLVKAQELVTGEAHLLWGDQAVVVSSLAEFKKAQQTLRRYALLIGIFASMGLVIAIINILNLMLARVLKRTKSIGLSMALGSSKGMIFRQFLLEALSMGLVGSILGIVVSFGLVSLLQESLGPLFGDAMYGTRIFFGMGLGLLTSLLFGVYPAYQGSRVTLVDALRFD